MLGKYTQSDKHYIGTAEGIIRAKGIKRLHKSERYKSTTSARWSGHPGNLEDHGWTTNYSFDRTCQRAPLLFLTDHFVVTRLRSPQPTQEATLGRAEDYDERKMETTASSVHLRANDPQLPHQQLLGMPTVSTPRTLRLIACGLPIFVMACYGSPKWSRRREFAFRSLTKASIPNPSYNSWLVVKKAMCGLKTVPKAWLVTFAETLADMGAEQLRREPNI